MTTLKEHLAAPVRIDRSMKELTIVHLAPRAQLPPHAHRSGYMVVPLAEGSLERITYAADGQELRREALALSPFVPYYMNAMESGQTIAIHNSGAHLVIWQKIINQPPPTNGQAPLPTERITIDTSDGKEHAFTVEMATTLKEQAIGLMFRPSLAAHHGMVFIWPGPITVAMTMKNVLFPLDILFIDAGGIITHIHHDAQPGDSTPVRSHGKVSSTLELPGGTAAAFGIKKGDSIPELRSA